ncbi:MFS transporter [Streptomyces sp. HUAS MG47]|uniref:MFS transporter n=1 Tax=Streptomyces solicamelliae TaxID=3231716 RepID=UPI003877D6B9
MTGTTEVRGGAAVDDAARSVTRPFCVYAVLANSLFQRGVFVLFLQQRGFSAGQVALLQTLLYLVSGLAELPTGVIADRIGRRAGMVIGQVLIAGCLLGQVASSHYGVFLVLFVGQGVGMALRRTPEPAGRARPHTVWRPASARHAPQEGSYRRRSILEAPIRS